MCGIAGMLLHPQEAVIRRMLDRQKHRGPDGRKIWLVPGGVGLGHDRLAIIDVAGGAQPIWNETGTLAAVVNGEIYNHQQLRRELEGRHTFRTQSDSEVVLHLFEEEGPEFVRRLDGMFAIAIWGAVPGLFLARDPLGIKPLYYGRDAAGNLLFASEIKALDHVRPAQPELAARRPDDHGAWAGGAGTVSGRPGAGRRSPGGTGRSSGRSWAVPMWLQAWGGAGASTPGSGGWRG